MPLCVCHPSSNFSLWPCPKALHPTLWAGHPSPAQSCLCKALLRAFVPGASRARSALRVGQWHASPANLAGCHIPTWGSPDHLLLPFSYRATSQRVRRRPLLSGTMTRSCNACVSTWTMPCCTGECRLLRGLMEPGTGTTRPSREMLLSLPASRLCQLAGGALSHSDRLPESTWGGDGMKAQGCLRQPNPGPALLFLPHRLQDLSSGYWVLVVHFTRREAVKQIEVLQHVATNLGRSE